MSGATRDDWQRFTRLGLTADLLPVVSDISVPIGANSTMKALGKTPSLVKGDGTAVGLAKWTQRVATADDVAVWQRDTRHGICLQTRIVRAIDIDVPDPAIADAIEAAVVSALDGIALPKRFRRDSGKRLLAFRYLSPMPKRVLSVDGGIVEILGDGQQFIADGTHPAGARYEWDSQGDFPILDDAQLAAVHRALETVFGDDKGWRIAREKREGVALEGSYTDEQAAWLVDNWEVYLEGDNGEIFLRCPFDGDHTSDSGPTSTAYLTAGTGGFEKGHWKCLHAHCQGYDDSDFEEATGYRASGFKALAVAEDASKPDIVSEYSKMLDLPLPGMKRTDGGDIEATQTNVFNALQAWGHIKMRLAFDTFMDEIVWAPLDDGLPQWRAFKDEHYADLRIALERIRFQQVGKDMLRLGVLHNAKANTIDTAREWLSRLQWDGTPRVSSFLADCFGVPLNDYTVAVSRYIWSAMAGRVIEPGVQADMVPMFIGEQGARKTTGIKAMAPSRQTYTTIDLDTKEADLARKLRGKLVAELEELRGLGTKEAEAIKAWVTRTEEEWSPKYVEFTTTFKRRMILLATGNDPGVLQDETGERRWLPMMVGKVSPERITRDRDQLWAEGAALFLVDGVQWQDAERLAEAEHHKFKAMDVWQTPISRWLHEPRGHMDKRTPAEDPEGVAIADVLGAALLMSVERQDMRALKRAGRVMRSLGWTSRLVGKERKSHWFAPEA